MLISNKNNPSPSKWNNFTGIVFEFQDVTRVFEQKLAYTLFSFYGEIGGYMGLLLGYSICQVVVVMFAKALQIMHSRLQ